MFFILLPILGLLISLISVLTVYYVFLKQLDKSKPLIKDHVDTLLSQEKIQDKWDLLLDEKLNSFITDLKTQIPMGSMLITQSLSTKIKEIAKSTLIKMTPDLKDKTQDILLDEIDLTTLSIKLFKKTAIKALVYALILGSLLGALLIPIVN